jgi:hypothetical protein
MAGGGRKGSLERGGEGFKRRIPERAGRWPEGQEGVLRSGGRAWRDPPSIGGECIAADHTVHMQMLRFWPQVWSTIAIPISPTSHLGSRPKRCKVSEVT